MLLPTRAIAFEIHLYDHTWYDICKYIRNIYTLYLLYLKWLYIQLYQCMCNVYAAMNMSYLYTILYFPPPTHQSSALHQAALDAMDVGPTLLQSNKAGNSQYQNPHWDPVEMGKEGYSGRISAFFFSSFFQESHLMMMPWRRMAGICMPQIEKRLKLQTTSI